MTDMNGVSVVSVSGTVVMFSVVVLFHEETAVVVDPGGFVVATGGFVRGEVGAAEGAEMGQVRWFS
jgi:hypothetical protein